jgi:hypothetical protein
MNTDPNETSRFPALDALGEDFLRAARGESRQRRRLRVRRLAVAGAIAAVMVPVGFAIAQSTGSTEPAAPPVPAASGNGCDGPAGASLRADLAQLCSPDASHDDLNTISSAPPPQPLVDECRANPNAESNCGIALAMADGKLAPGTYTDEELQAAVKAAGYRWSP